MKKILMFLLFPLPLLPQAASINGGTLLQPIDGFGVAQAFSGPTSTTPINAEFSPTGIGLKYIRTQIYPDQADCAAKEGNPCASAAQGGTISLNDLAVVQAAVSNGAILWGSMWSPPASMKSNGSFQGTGNMIGNPTNYAALATIQASFVTLLTGTYGIPVYAISVQNEPNVTVAYQSCLWTATQLHDYIPYLKTALTNAGYPNVKIMISEPAGWAQGPTYNSTSMNDATVAGDIGILANHQYDYTYAAQSYSNVTTQHLWETEVSDGNTYDGSMTSGLTYGLLIHNSLVTAKVNAWHYWLATDAAGRGDNESLTNSSYSIAKRAYVMGQWARCATGKTEIAATANPQSGVYVTAFLNSSSGSFCIVALNNNSGTVSQTFNLSGGLSASSMSTLFTNPSSNMASGSSISVSGSSFTASLTGSSVSTFFSNPGTTNYNITITASNGTLSGGTNCVAGTNSYASGTSISCPPPTPNAGYAFAGWSGTGSFSSASGTGTVSGTLTSNSTLTATITPSTAPWSGLLAASRAINWGSAGAGTIPNRTTICTTLGTASQAPTFAQSVTSAQIVAAIAACPANQVVYLNAGTYSLSTSIMGPGNGGAWPNNVTLRGAGANQTILKFSAFTNNCLGYGPTGVCMYNGSSGVAQYADNIMTVSGGVSGGATSITLGSAASAPTCNTGSACPGNISNLHVGSLMEINQQDDCNDTGDWFESGYGPNLGNNCQLVTWGGTSNAWPPNWPSGTTNLGRSLTQVVRVTNISGSTITFSPALYGGKWNQSKSPLAIYSNAAPLVGASIENLKIDTTLLGDEQAMLGTVWNYGCWYTNVAFVNPTTTSTSLATRKHALLASGLNNTFANNYMYGSASGSDAYGVDQVQGETNDLIQNNIAHHMASAFMTETAVGSVFGYNFDADNYYFNGNGAQWQQAELYHHDAGDMFNLYEGHEGIEAINDDIHGTSFGLTYFRNYLSGHDKATMCPGGGNACGTSAAGKIQNTAAYDDFAFARYANFAFNVIGDGTYANTYNNVGTQGTPNSCPGYAWTVLYTLNFSNSNQQPFSPNCTGTSYTIDNDSLVATSLMRWGNYDTVTSTVRTVTGENGSSAPTYPALVSPSTSYSSFPSLYLPGKPVWWQFINGNASTPFPATGPDVTGGNIANVGGHANHNPAGNCYLNVLMGKQDGSSGPLNYDASLCYPTTAPPQAATPVPSPTPGSYAGPLNVTFTDSTPASSMFCTTDGSTPTPASAAYPSGGFTLSATGTYQCVATAAGLPLRQLEAGPTRSPHRLWQRPRSRPTPRRITI